MAITTNTTTEATDQLRINRAFVNDNDISFEARGLYYCLLAGNKVDGYTTNEMIAMGKNVSRAKIRRFREELVAKGLYRQPPASTRKPV